MKIINNFIRKVQRNQIDKLKEKEIDEFIDDNWLLWTCKFELHPCGQLTKIGKQRYVEDNREEILELIEEIK